MSNSSNPRLSTSPVRSFSSDAHTTPPGTPGLRNRKYNVSGEFEVMTESGSLTSATISDAGGSFYRMNEPPEPTLRHAPLTGSVRKKIIIRSDPSLVSCFDPADKELYDLWASKP